MKPPCGAGCEETNCCSIGRVLVRMSGMKKYAGYRCPTTCLDVTPSRLNWQCVQWRHVVTSLWASPNFLRNLLHPSLHLDLSFPVHLLNKQCVCWQMLTACTWQMLTACKWWIVQIKVVSTKKIFVWEERRGIWATNQGAFVPIGKRVRRWYRDINLVISDKPSPTHQI